MHGSQVPCIWASGSNLHLGIWDALLPDTMHLITICSVVQTKAQLDTVNQRLAALEPEHAQIVAALKAETERADRTTQEVRESV